MRDKGVQGKRPRSRRRKVISRTSITGDQGIAFIHGVVSRCGLMWVENKGAADVGIDGFIELSDPTTHEAFNRRICVQSKSGPSWFRNESESSFEFTCEEVDLNYWMSGDAPVLLVVSRNGVEGYWKSIKDYFADTSRRASRRIIFDKAADRFDDSVQSKLLSLTNLGPGAFLAPIPKPETLFSNLVPVELAFNTLFVACTTVDSQAEFDRAATSCFDQVGWAVRDGLAVSCFDLSSPAFRSLVQAGTVEQWSLEEVTQNMELQPRLTQLLNRLLKEFLADFDVNSIPRSNPIYYFRGVYRAGGVSSRTLQYRSYKESTSREVVQNYSSNPRFPCWKHSSAEINFKPIDSKWYAVIVPSYVFTSDGYKFHDLRAERLTKIKSLEHNLAVRGQVRMWADLMLYNQPTLDGVTPLLKFGKQISVTLGVGLVDDNWLPTAKDVDNDQGLGETNGLGGLFD